MADTDPAEAGLELRDPLPLRLSGGQWVLELLKQAIGNSEPPRTFYSTK